jgi:tetratricopeptide (TPR) repeat protein
MHAPLQRRCLATLGTVLVLACPARPSRVPASTFAQAPQTDFAAVAKAAAAARDAGDTNAAIENYRRAVNIRPDWQEGWFYLGTLEYGADRYSDAIPAFQKLVELAPNIGPAWNFLGLCEFETKDYANSLIHLEKGQELGAGDDPEVARVSQYHLALLLNRNAEFDRATAMLISAFPEGQFPAQAKLALGLALLNAPVLPDELNPSQDALVHAAGEIAALLARGDSAKALEAFPHLLNEYPNTPYLHGAYAKALAAAGRNDEALAQLEMERTVTAKITPERTQRQEKLRQIYGLPSAAGRNEIPQTDTDDQWNSAMNDYSSRRYPEAVATLKTWVERRPASRKMNDGTAWAVMGLSEFELRDYDNALIHLQRGQDLGLGGSSDSIRLARYHLAILLNRGGQYDSASRLLAPEANSGTLANEIQFALGISLLRMPLLPEQVPPPQRSLVQSAGEIAILLNASKYDQAFPKLQQILKEHPTTPFLHYAYGLALASLSQYDEAETKLREESRISPQSDLPYVLLASIALRKHDPADALPSAERAVQLAPESAKTHYILGRASLESGQVEKAIHELEAANKINPGSPEIHFNLAKAYAKGKQPEKAEEQRALFARLNALAEQQRAQGVNQSSGAAVGSMDLSPTQTLNPKPAGPEQR